MITSWAYDKLNRVTGVTRSGAASVSPTIIKCYDGNVVSGTGCAAPQTAIPQSHGRLTAEQATTPNGSGSVVTGAVFSQYDTLGRVTASTQTTAGSAFPFIYAYDLAGGLLQETYPSGRVVTTTYDDAERPTGVTGSLARRGSHIPRGRHMLRPAGWLRLR